MFKGSNVTVMVSDLNQAVVFYTETLGLKLQYQVPGHWAQVEAPGVIIGLHPAGEHGPKPGSSESMSIGFEADHFDSAVETLKARGIVFTHMMDDKATRLAYFGDPDGNPLYVVEVKHGQ